ncbi:MAG: hypothetical protein R8G34_00710 [Paracoccaceae bacterium]|nr:hypothetical protein [Paracoccaceae bacterium]
MTFTFTEKHIRRMFELANFEVPEDEMVFFGLRGSSPVTNEGVFDDSHVLIELGTDWTHQRCTIGQWLPGKSFAIHTASTVPNIVSVRKKINNNGYGVNMLAPCYLTDLPGTSDHRYTKGDHGLTSKLGPHRAFRNANKLPVWRTGDDDDYEGDDRLVYESAFDNLHCSRHMDSTTPGYSSFGCQVVAGAAGRRTSNPGGEKGSWKAFVNAAYALSQHSFRYALFNQGEALRTATLGVSKRSPTVRFGSTGDLVLHLQEALVDGGFNVGRSGPDGILGFKTLEAIRDIQLEAFGASGVDLVCGQATAAEIGIDWPAAVGKKPEPVHDLENGALGAIDLLDEGAGPEIDDKDMEVFFVTPTRETKPNGKVRWVFEDPVDKTRRYVGGEAKLQGFRGLARIRGFDAEKAPVYDHKDWIEQFGAWAAVIEPTGLGESQNSFTCLNSYDRAAFTFGFYQLAAHTANDNLILLFRKLLESAEASRYFPDLRLIGGKVHKETTSGAVSLEGAQRRVDGNNRVGEQGGFMDYLNGDMNSVDPAELQAASRLIHWAVHSEEHRSIQVEVAVELARKKVKRIADRMSGQGTSLDGRPVREVALALDILHNGRGGSETFPRIGRALKSDDPMAELSKIGCTDIFAGRIDRVRKAAERIQKLKRLKGLRYDVASNDFV